MCIWNGHMNLEAAWIYYDLKRHPGAATTYIAAAYYDVDSTSAVPSTQIGFSYVVTIFWQVWRDFPGSLHFKWCAHCRISHINYKWTSISIVYNVGLIRHSTRCILITSLQLLQGSWWPEWVTLVMSHYSVFTLRTARAALIVKVELGLVEVSRLVAGWLARLVYMRTWRRRRRRRRVEWWSMCGGWLEVVLCAVMCNDHHGDVSITHTNTAWQQQ